VTLDGVHVTKRKRNREKLERALSASLTDKEFQYANKLGNSDGAIDRAVVHRIQHDVCVNR